ncbi:hypothetical protein RIF29_04509 [Crotalaria pallida]|uniref:Uncharacterized protein n=1 Tax=Crotalaria pallida TaxID=3830 RepID=A0AAN9J131_CROPI
MAEEPNANRSEQESPDLKLMKEGRTRETVPELLNRFASSIMFPEPGNSGSLINRIKISFLENAPFLPGASINSANDVLLWTHRGSPLRALLVISVKSISPIQY